MDAIMTIVDPVAYPYDLPIEHLTIWPLACLLSLGIFILLIWRSDNG